MQIIILKNSPLNKDSDLKNLTMASFINDDIGLKRTRGLQQMEIIKYNPKQFYDKSS